MKTVTSSEYTKSDAKAPQLVCILHTAYTYIQGSSAAAAAFEKAFARGLLFLNIALIGREERSEGLDSLENELTAFASF